MKRYAVEIILSVVALVMLVSFINWLHAAPQRAATNETAKAIPAGTSTTARSLDRDHTADPDAERDIKVVNSSCKKGGFGSVALWNITLHNTSTTFTYRDIAYRTTYLAPSGTVLSTNRRVIYDVLMPGQTKHFAEINDGLIRAQTTRCGFAISR